MACIRIRGILGGDDAAMAGIVRSNLRAYGLDIPGTAYFDPQLDRLSLYYARPGCTGGYFVAEAAGEVVGGIGVEVFPGFPACGEIQKLYLRDDWKGHGVGQALLDHLEAYARSLGMERLYLETHSNLRAAVRFYEKNGYRPIPRPAGVVHGTMDLFYLKDLLPG